MSEGEQGAGSTSPAFSDTTHLHYVHRSIMTLPDNAITAVALVKVSNN